MSKNFKIETREETIARYRADFVEAYARTAFNFEEALREFDRDPESFDMEFYSLADVVVAKLKEHPHADSIKSSMFEPYNHNCSTWGWFCKPGHYPSITF